MQRRFLGSLAMILAAGGLFSMAPLPANAVTSTFDGGLEEWRAVGLTPMLALPPSIPVSENGPDMVHSPMDGNPATSGYARFTDAIQDPSSLAAAPAPFLGDLSSFIGGSLSFDHKLFDPGPSATGFAPYVVILVSGQPSDLNALVWTAPAPTGATEWVHFDITLDLTDLTPIADLNLSDIDPSFPNIVPSNPPFNLGGAMSFREIMENVDLLLLPFELVDNASDQMEEHGGLDNVMLTAVPEPTTGAMLALGLSGLVAHARGRRVSSR